MHPALSVIFFTVLSGAGFGLYILLISLSFFLYLPKQVLLNAGCLSLVLIAVGLVSSTFHLNNPKNMWRALSQFKTSWLSREGVFALLFFPMSFAFLILYFFGYQDLVIVKYFLTSSSLLLSCLCLFSTGMIYASLKTIPQWNTLLTPMNYFIIGLGTGGLVLFPIISSTLQEPLLYAHGLSLFLSLGFVIKLNHINRNQRLKPVETNKALGLKKRKMKLSNKGHSAKTFLDKEFSYKIKKTSELTLQIFSLFLTYVLPITLLLLYNYAPFIMMCSAILFSLCGALLERWLFFATANHVVNSYIR